MSSGNTVTNCLPFELLQCSSGWVVLEQIERIQRLQNKAARLVKRIPKNCHITPVLRELHWLYPSTKGWSIKSFYMYGRPRKDQLHDTLSSLFMFTILADHSALLAEGPLLAVPRVNHAVRERGREGEKGRERGRKKERKIVFKDGAAPMESPTVSIRVSRTKAQFKSNLKTHISWTLSD